MIASNILGAGDWEFPVARPRHCLPYNMWEVSAYSLSIKKERDIC